MNKWVEVRIFAFILLFIFAVNILLMLRFTHVFVLVAIALVMYAIVFIWRRLGKNAKKIIKIILLLFLLFVTWVTVFPMIGNPERRPRFLVRHYVLRQTPMGTNIHDVIEFVENRNDWYFGSADFEQGFGRPPEIVGEMRVTATRGKFHAWYIMLGLPEVSTLVNWAFDEDGKLIAVRVLHAWSP